MKDRAKDQPARAAAPGTVVGDSFAAGVSPARRWLLCLLLLAATTLNYLDRQTLSILAPFIQQDLGLDNEALGWTFSAFYYAYTLAQFGVGAVLDRTHLGWSYSLAVLAWSGAAALTGLARSFGALLSFRILLGVAEAANWPAAMRIVARTLPPQDRALGNGIFTSGTSLGALIAPALALGAAAWVGWRGAFPAVASLGLLWFVAWLWFTAHPGFAPVWRGSPRARSPVASYAAILRAPQFWRVFAITILVNPCLYFNVNWLPTYFVQERRVTPGRFLGAVLTLIYVGLDAGYLTCGFAVRQLSKRYGLRRARRIVFLTATALLSLALGIPLLPSVGWAAAALVLVNMGAGMWIAMYLTLAQEVSTRDVATAAGLLGGSGSLAGGLAMWAVGRVTRLRRSFTLPFVGVGMAAVLAGLAGLAATGAAAAREESDEEQR